MKKMVFFALVLCGITGNVVAQGQKTLTRYEGQVITGIDAWSAFDIKVRQGKKTQVVLNIPARLESQLEFVLEKDGKVKFGFRGNTRWKQGEKCSAEVVCSSLEEVELSGACTMTGEGEFSGRQLKFDLSGASKVNFSGKIQVVEKMETDMSGATVLNAAVVAPRSEIEVSGASVLSFSGSSDNVSLEASGASKADLGGFTARQMDLDVSGASKVVVNVTEVIRGEASGASKVVYEGAPQMQVKVSGAASLRKK